MTIGSVTAGNPDKEGRKNNLVEPIGSESFGMHVLVAEFSCPLTRRICSRTTVLLPRKLFLANVIIDPLEDWPETELSSCDGLHHKFVRGQWFHFEVISVD